MMRQIPAPFRLLACSFLLLSVVGAVQATTWTNPPVSQDWGNVTNWIGGALPTDVAYLPSAAANTSNKCPDLIGNAYTVNELSLQTPVFLFGNGTNTVGGLLTLNAASSGAETNTGLKVTPNGTGAAYVYANLALGMANRTNDLKWNVANNIVNCYGDIGGAGTLHITMLPAQYTGNTFFYSNLAVTNGPTFNGDMLVDLGQTVRVIPTNITNNISFRFGRNAAAGLDTWGGNITLTAGYNSTLGAGTAQPGPTWHFVPVSATTNATIVTLQNDFVVSGMPGATFALSLGRSSVPLTFPKLVYAGKLTLGGRLQCQSQTSTVFDGFSSQNSGINTTSTLCFTSGTYVSQTAAARASLQLGGVSAGGVTWLWPSVISDSLTGTYCNPLILALDGSQWLFCGTNSTYKYGTVIPFCGVGNGGFLYDTVANQNISINAPGGLGTGNVTVQPGGQLLLAVSNVMTSAQQVTLQGNGAAMGTISITDGGTIPTFSSNSKGVIGLAGASGTAFNNLMAAGVSDNVFLGAGMVAGTFNGTSLKAGSDNVQRIGGGGCSASLTIVATNVLTGANSVQVNSPAYNGGGKVFLSATNNFTGSLSIYGGFLTPYISVLQGVASTGSSFGAANGAVNLFGARMQLTGSGVSTKGATVFTSESSLEVVPSGTTHMTNSVATLSRTNNGFLHIKAVASSPVLNNTNMVMVQSPGADLTPTNGMVSPYYLYDQNDSYAFATYSTGSGFTKAVWSANVLATPSTAMDIVTQGTASITANRSCYALKTTGAITDGGGSDFTIAIGSGGLILGNNIGSAAGPNVNLDFGGNEAVICCTVASTIYGAISNTGGYGLTKIGAYNLYDNRDLTLTNLNNSFTGPITVNSGMLYITPDKDDNSASGSLGPLSNNILLNGGCLGWPKNTPAGYTTLSSNRTITLGPLGGAFYSNGRGGALTVNSKITGVGALYASGGNLNCQINNSSNDYSGGTLIMDSTSAIDVSATGKLGQGPVCLFGSGTAATAARFNGNENLHYTAGPEVFLPMQVSTYSIASFLCSSPVMGALTGDGNVILGTTATNCTLTVGLDNADASFHGYLSQGFGVTGAVVKAGTGTWNLYGAQSYLGQTSVTNGTLNLMGSVASNLVVYPSGTLTGLGLISGNLTINGTYLATTGTSITVAGNITLGGALTIPDGAKFTTAGSTILTTTGGTIGGHFASIPVGLRTQLSADGKSYLLLQQPGTGVFFR